VLDLTALPTEVGKVLSETEALANGVNIRHDKYHATDTSSFDEAVDSTLLAANHDMHDS